MNAQLDSWLDDLRNVSTIADAEQRVARRHSTWLLDIPDDALNALWQALPAAPDAYHDARRELLNRTLQCLVQGARQRQEAACNGLPIRPDPQMGETQFGETQMGAEVEANATDANRSQARDASLLQRLETLYRSWGPAMRCRFQLLAWLTASRGAARLGMLAELLASDPPRDSTEVMQVLGPLFQRPDEDVKALFPRLLDGLEHVSLAAPILDLANFLARQGHLLPHPAANRSAALVRLLDSVSERLRGWESVPQGDEESSAAGGELGRGQRQVFESLALVISLCDTLALIGDRSATRPLQHVMQLRHRRIRTEAAAALARLGDDSGAETLVALAAEPVARLRVLAYADEMGLRDRVDDRFQTPVALAEAELALWLAQPVQFGVPPRDIELFDRRSLYWPGYEEPVDCYLFRFTYPLADVLYSNIAIVGPLTHAFRADLTDLTDLTDLSPDDIYAAFAGWHAEHDEIFHQDAAHVGTRQQAELTRLERRLHDAGYDQIEPQLLGHFLRDLVLVASASREGQAGTAVVDPLDIDWRPRTATKFPLGPEDWYCVYKGRRMLRAFNP